MRRGAIRSNNSSLLIEDHPLSAQASDSIRQSTVIATRGHIDIIRVNCRVLFLLFKPWKLVKGFKIVWRLSPISKVTSGRIIFGHHCFDSAS